MKLNKIAVIGLGIIGGSIVKALKAKGYAGSVCGVDLDALNYEAAYAEGTIVNKINGYETALVEADLVILATPLGVYRKVMGDMKPFLKATCIVSDVGSVKGIAHEAAREMLGDGITFIGGHPMAGSEKSGYSHAQIHLFENVYYFLTDDQDEENDSRALIKEFVTFIGAKPYMLQAEEHDAIVSMTSHMPHITAVMLVDLLKNEEKNLFGFVGGGFRDTTRIASGHPDIWKDIIMFNKKEILGTLDKLMRRLGEFRHVLETDNAIEIYNLLSDSKRSREGIPKHLIDSIEEELALYLDVEDKPGIIAEASMILYEDGINIKDIEIMHSRENVQGVLKIGFYIKSDHRRAEVVLKEHYDVSI